ASCGIGNSYGHPHQQTINNLAALGYDITDNFKRTDIDGDVALSVKQDPDTGVFALYLGADAVNPRTPGAFPEMPWLSWWHIAAVIWLAGIVVILFVIKTQRPAKKSGSSAPTSAVYNKPKSNGATKKPGSRK
ncbi:MAG: hypothetical protein LBS99_07920, partial [Clostridiales bacterium]|nr:hypothetical protein [Clostridiales bacterium]